VTLLVAVVVEAGEAEEAGAVVESIQTALKARRRVVEAPDQGLKTDALQVAVREHQCPRARLQLLRQR